MVRPFPIRESSILSLSEMVSRVLGLLFLAHFVSHLGLAESAAFRIVLPLIGVAAALGSIGLPQALTRLFATLTDRSRLTVPQSMLFTSLLATFCAALITILLLTALSAIAMHEAVNKQELARLLQITAPLLLLMCVTGSMRGILLGLGSTYAPAIAQVLEVGSRLLMLTTLLPYATHALQADGAQLGILTLTVGEAVAGLFLSVVLWMMLRRRGVRRDHRMFSYYLLGLFTVLRMSIASTGQALLASLGYALELPLALELLTRTHGTVAAEHLVAEYTAIAIPLLCAPMVLTDGIATALLPIASAERAQSGGGAFSAQVRRVIGAIALIAIPTTGALFVLAPTLTGWFGSSTASLMLLLLAPLTLPLYLQAPLSSLLQAQGYSRALLVAGLCGDAARIGGLLLGVSYLHLDRMGLLLAFASSVLVQTTVLLMMASRMAPVTLPWQTLLRSVQLTLPVAALLLVATHAPVLYSFQAHPLLWGLLTVASATFFLLLAKEITPHDLSRLPVVGRPLGSISRQIVRRLTD